MHDRELLAQGEVLDDEAGARAKGREEGAEERCKAREHRHYRRHRVSACQRRIDGRDDVRCRASDRGAKRRDLGSNELHGRLEIPPHKLRVEPDHMIPSALQRPVTTKIRRRPTRVVHSIHLDNEA